MSFSVSQSWEVQGPHSNGGTFMQVFADNISRGSGSMQVPILILLVPGNGEMLYSRRNEDQCLST